MKYDDLFSFERLIDLQTWLSKPVREYFNISWGDGGAFVDQAKLYKYEDRWVLIVGYGYAKAHDFEWYLLEAEPTKWPEEGDALEEGGFAVGKIYDFGDGQLKELVDAFGVNGTKIERNGRYGQIK